LLTTLVSSGVLLWAQNRFLPNLDPDPAGCEFLNPAGMEIVKSGTTLLTTSTISITAHPTNYQYYISNWLRLPPLLTGLFYTTAYDRRTGRSWEETLPYCWMVMILVSKLLFKSVKQQRLSAEERLRYLKINTKHWNYEVSFSSQLQFTCSLTISARLKLPLS